ncbi:MAG: hypothetical protein A3F68_01720 [Acidobacteria bacterium RIFCSPLOWO2_12_FULL_54_10]|nr:MAG: hypothetical protein A3F68_01720 [Acidobacteria bacterium RIFCSPLOWO2_12_FULL_54_10]
MPEIPSSQNTIRKTGLFLGIVLFLAILLLPPPGGMELPAQRMAAVAALMASWWITEAVPIAVTSLLPLVLFPVLGISPSDKVAPYYADHTIYLFLGGFIVALAIQKWNLHRRIALHIICRLGLRPSRLVLGFMVSTAFLSMWMSNTACAMMMYPIGMSLVTQLATAPGEGTTTDSAPDATVMQNFGVVLMLAIAYAASIGGMGTLIGTPPNLVFAGAAHRLFPEAPEVGFLQWMKIGVPMVVLFVPLAWIYLCRFGSPVPVSGIHFRSNPEIIQDELRKLGKLSAAEKRVLAIWVSMAFLWITRSPLTLGSINVPGWSQLLGQYSSYVHDATVSMAMALLLFLMPVPQETLNNGQNQRKIYLMDWETVRHGVPWEILLLFGGGFALAAGFEQTGLSAWIGTLLNGLAGLSPVLIAATVCLGITLFSEMASNTATALLAMPILAATALQIGVHPYLLMVSGTLAASCGFMLPVATPPNAIAYSSGWITSPQMARAGLALDLMGILLITLIVYWLGAPVFGISMTQLPAWAK